MALDIRHPDGDRLSQKYLAEWFQRRVHRIAAYLALGDQVRAKTETGWLYSALDTGRISWSALDEGETA